MNADGGDFAVYKWTSVIPGMAVHLNCSSVCLPIGETVEWSLLPNHSGPPVNVTSGGDYVASVDNGLVIVNVNANEDVGTFQCTYGGHVLTQHRISISGAAYSKLFIVLAA